MRTPRMPGPSPEEQAMTRRQRTALDKEIEANEARLKKMARGRPGKGSLLGFAGMDDELGGGARGTGGIASTLFGAGDKGVPGGRTITSGFIKSKKTGQTLKVPDFGPGSRGESAKRKYLAQHGASTGSFSTSNKKGPPGVLRERMEGSTEATPQQAQGKAS